MDEPGGIKGEEWGMSGGGYNRASVWEVVSQPCECTKLLNCTLKMRKMATFMLSVLYHTLKM